MLSFLLNSDVKIKYNLNHNSDKYKKKFNNHGQQFHQYQQNKQSPFTSTH